MKYECQKEKLKYQAAKCKKKIAESKTNKENNMRTFI